MQCLARCVTVLFSHLGQAYRWNEPWAFNKTGIKCGTFDNAIKQFHRQRVRTTEKAEKKVVRPKACSAKKSGPALTGPVGPPTTALQSLTFLTDHYSVLFLGTQDGTRVDIWCTGTQVSFITKTRLYNFDPLKPHFYIVKLRFTGVYIIFHISAQNIDCGYPLEPPRWGGSNECPQSMFWAEIWKISEFFIWKFSVFGGEIFYTFV